MLLATVILLDTVPFLYTVTLLDTVTFLGSVTLSCWDGTGISKPGCLCFLKGVPLRSHQPTRLLYSPCVLPRPCLAQTVFNPFNSSTPVEVPGLVIRQMWAAATKPHYPLYLLPFQADKHLYNTTGMSPACKPPRFPSCHGFFLWSPSSSLPLRYHTLSLALPITSPCNSLYSCLDHQSSLQQPQIFSSCSRCCSRARDLFPSPDGSLSNDNS